MLVGKETSYPFPCGNTTHFLNGIAIAKIF